MRRRGKEKEVDKEERKRYENKKQRWEEEREVKKVDKKGRKRYENKTEIGRRGGMKKLIKKKEKDMKVRQRLEKRKALKGKEK